MPSLKYFEIIDRETDLYRSFVAFAKYGHAAGDGTILYYCQIKQWFSQAASFTKSDIDIVIPNIFSQFTTSISLNFWAFRKFLRKVAEQFGIENFEENLIMLPDYDCVIAPSHLDTGPKQLFDYLRIYAFTQANYTRTIIKENARQMEKDIKSWVMLVSLLCPLGKSRFVTPCRSFTCQHLQCFDAWTFLNQHELNTCWKCPICNKEIKYQSLMIDGYFQEILVSPEIVSSNENLVIILEDGTWHLHESISTTPVSYSGINSSNQNENIDSKVIDLTLDSDDE